MDRVVIIGGGISGLSTAYYLHKAGIRSTIIERESRLGGVIRTEVVDDCIVEHGPDSFLTTKTAASDLAIDLGLQSELIGSNDQNRGTYIWRGGRLRKMPEGMTLMVPTRIGPLMSTNLLSWPGKIRAGLDLFQRPKKNEQDRSISEFVTDHFGSEVLEYIAEPLIAGVYGGDPSALSIRSTFPQFAKWEAEYGSLTRAGQAQKPNNTGPLFSTLKRGLQSLIDALVEQAQPDIVRGKVEKIEKGWRVRVNGDWLEASHLVVACRAEAVLPSLFPPIPYNSAKVIAVGYRREDVKTDFKGFGFLVPRIERRTMSACTWVPNKFDHRVTPDKLLLRCFTTGGADDVRQELQQKLGIDAKPLFVREAAWPQSMPQYEVGHELKVRMIDEMLLDFPGLYLVGNAYSGIGIPDCIRIAKGVAGRIAGLVNGQRIES